MLHVKGLRPSIGMFSAVVSIVDSRLIAIPPSVALWVITTIDEGEKCHIFYK